MIKLPRIKTGSHEVYSHLGNISVTRTEEGLTDDDFGGVSFNKRTVVIHTQTSPQSEWPTYWHEAIHIALLDSGCGELLSDEVEEAICNALGSYLTGMMQAGMLKVSRKK